MPCKTPCRNNRGEPHYPQHVDLHYIRAARVWSCHWAAPFWCRSSRILKLKFHSFESDGTYTYCCPSLPYCLSTSQGRPPVLCASAWRQFSSLLFVQSRMTGSERQSALVRAYVPNHDDHTSRRPTSSSNQRTFHHVASVILDYTTLIDWRKLFHVV